MPKMVIEVPEEFVEVGKAMAEYLAALQRTVSRLGGGRAVLIARKAAVTTLKLHLNPRHP